MAKLIVATGTLLFFAALVLLGGGAALPGRDALLLAVLLVAVPALSLAQLPLARDAAELERIPAYWSSIVALWLVGSACWLVGTRSSGPAGLGLVPIPVVPLLGWTAVLTVAGLGLTALFRVLTVRLGRSDPALLHLLLPRTVGEKGVFAVLSVSAGVGEELAYRGYAILTLAPVLGTLGAAAVSTVVFGIIHAYQGTIGIARTGVMGAVLAWGFLAAGSLWPPILAHTLIDILAGIVLGRRLLVEGAEAPWK